MECDRSPAALVATDARACISREGPAGGLDDSWRQQPGTPVYGAEVGADGVRAALAAALRERPSHFRA
ncbi:MAG: hypothetical protein NVSMB16_01980 [Acidimicrobiales bacterium]